MSNLDTDVTVEASPSDWMFAEYELSGILSERYVRLAGALDKGDRISAEVIKDGIRPLERVRHAILEAVYPESEAPDGIDLAKATVEGYFEDHGYPLLSVGER